MDINKYDLGKTENKNHLLLKVRRPGLYLDVKYLGTPVYATLFHGRRDGINYQLINILPSMSCISF